MSYEAKIFIVKYIFKNLVLAEYLKYVAATLRHLGDMLNIELIKEWARLTYRTFL